VYVNSAGKRGVAFDLSKGEAETLFSKNCHYCDATADPKNGIDRVDNTLGYTPTNTVPCCSVCNMMKGQMDVEDFLRQVQLIADRLPTLNIETEN